MAKVCCSLCFFDAIFTSSDDNFKACAKCYFSDQAQRYKLERIKIPINNKSKEILYRFIVELKWNFKARSDNLIEKNYEKVKEYQENLDRLNEGFDYCNRIALSLIKAKWVLKKLILTPFEYFLTQPEEKAQQYIKLNWYREGFLELCPSIRAHVFDFNYFQFENQKYIHGWAYKSSYDRDRLSDFYGIIFLDFIKMSEYEMAYELYQNLLSYLEFYDHSSIQKFKGIFDWFGNIFKEIMLKNENYSQLYERWKFAIKHYKKANKKPNDQSSKNVNYWLCYFLDKVISMMKIDSNLSEYYCKILCKVECSRMSFTKNFANIINQELGLLYYGSKNYTKAIERFNKSIAWHREHLLEDTWQNRKGLWNDSLEYWIEAYLWLAKAYSAAKNNDKVRAILDLFKFKSSSSQFKFQFYAMIGEIHYLLNNFNRAFKYIMKCIRMSNKIRCVHSYELSNLRLRLAEIHTWKGDFKKANESLSCAKSLCSILYTTDSNEQEIYKKSGVFYLVSQRYKEALKCFRCIEQNDRWSNHELLFAKLCMGIAYFWMLNKRAWKLLSKAKQMMSEFTESYKNELFIVNAYIGELYNLKGNLKKADKYFNKAFDLIDHYDILNIDIFLKSQSFVFSYFYWKSDYEKCGFILLRINEILKINRHIKFRKPYYLIKWAELHMSLNEMKEAEKCLSKAEVLLNANKIILTPQKSIKINDLDCISDYIELAKVYINLSNTSDEYRQKAKKILKYAEKVVNTKRLNDMFSKLAINYCLWALYFKEQKWEKSKRYYQISLDLYKQFKHNSKAVRDFKKWAVSMEKYSKFMGRKYQINIKN